MRNPDVGPATTTTNHTPLRSWRNGQDPLATEIGTHDPDDVTPVVSHVATSLRSKNDRDELPRTGSGCLNRIDRGRADLEFSRSKSGMSGVFPRNQGPVTSDCGSNRNERSSVRGEEQVMKTATAAPPENRPSQCSHTIDYTRGMAVATVRIRYNHRLESVNFRTRHERACVPEPEP